LSFSISMGSLFRRRAVAAPVASLACILATSCCHKQPECPSAPAPGQKCALGVPAAPSLPHLYRAVSALPARARYAAAPICTTPHALSDECEVVDDVQAMLGTGFDCVNGSDAAVGACEGWTEPKPLTSASSGDPPCGATACPNLVLSVRDPSGAPVRVTFYDDISCHRAPREPNCQKSGRACYYRVLRVDHT
jgi:hypothetical protein